MDTVSPRTAVERLDLSSSLLRALDRPARQALELSRRPFLETAAPALLGLFLIAAASVLAGLATAGEGRIALRLDPVRAALESLCVVVPGTAVFATYLRLRISTRAFLAGTAIGLLAAGLMAACVLPLMGFLVLLSTEQSWFIEGLPAVLVPGLALATVTVFPMRVITSLDRSSAAFCLSRAFAFLLIAVFMLRVHTFATQLFLQSR
jgi:hypothetical protein